MKSREKKDRRVDENFIGAINALPFSSETQRFVVRCARRSGDEPLDSFRCFSSNDIGFRVVVYLMFCVSKEEPDLIEGLNVVDDLKRTFKRVKVYFDEAIKMVEEEQQQKEKSFRFSEEEKGKLHSEASRSLSCMERLSRYYRNYPEIGWNDTVRPIIKD